MVSHIKVPDSDAAQPLNKQFDRVLKKELDEAQKTINKLYRHGKKQDKKILRGTNHGHGDASGVRVNGGLVKGLNLQH